MGRTLVLDSGALIDLERGGRMAIALADQADELAGEIVIPASVLGQVWRGGPRSARLARLIAGAEVDVLDERRAREVGERLGARGGSDVVDAHVACCAGERDAAVATADVDDLHALALPGERMRTIRVG